MPSQASLDYARALLEVVALVAVTIAVVRYAARKGTLRAVDGLAKNRLG